MAGHEPLLQDPRRLHPPFLYTAMSAVVRVLIAAAGLIMARSIGLGKRCARRGAGGVSR